MKCVTVVPVPRGFENIRSDRTKCHCTRPDQPDPIGEIPRNGITRTFTRLLLIKLYTKKHMRPLPRCAPRFIPGTPPFFFVSRKIVGKNPRTGEIYKTKNTPDYRCSSKKGWITSPINPS
jgi:hypothetical protein